MKTLREKESDAKDKSKNGTPTPSIPDYGSNPSFMLQCASLLFNALSPIREQLSGGIFLESRPEYSHLEDILIRTHTYTDTSLPYKAYSEIHLYVPHLMISIDGKEQYTPHLSRIDTLDKVLYTQLKKLFIPEKALCIEKRTLSHFPQIQQSALSYHLIWYLLSN